VFKVTPVYGNNNGLLKSKENAKIYIFLQGKGNACYVNMIS